MPLFSKADEPPKKVSFKVVVTGAFNDSTKGNLKNPTIRYTFWGGQRETTPELADASRGWKEVKIETNRENTSRANYRDNHNEEATDSEGSENEGSATAESRMGWAWEKTYGVMLIDRDFALRLNQQSVILFTLADRATGEAATAVLPVQNAAEGRPSSTGSSSSGQSCPLQRKASVSGERKGSLTDAERRPSFTGGQQQRIGSFKRAPSLLPPTVPVGRNFLHTVALDTSPLLSPDFNGTLTQTFDALDPTACPPPPGLTYLKIELVADKQGQCLLTESLLHELNPMTIHIRDIQNSPGLCFDTLPGQRYLQPTPYYLLNQYCRPLYVTAQPFCNAQLLPRIVRTNGNSHKKHVVLDQKTIYLTGHLDQNVLEEYLEKCKIQIEVHDRDALSRGSQGFDKQSIAKLEKLVTGGYPMSIGTGELIEDADTSQQDQSKIEIKGPMSVFEVDDLLLQEWETEALKARNRYNHGTAAVSLAGLLNTSKQLSTAFARNHQKDSTTPSETSAMDTQPIVKGRFDIVPQKPVRKAKGGNEEEEWNMKDEERLVRHEIPRYLEKACTLGITVALHRPVRLWTEDKKIPTTESDEVDETFLFGRAVIIVEYENFSLLEEIVKAIDEVNADCLPHAGSLRSYQLTSEEIGHAEKGELDIICGFQLIDDDCRMFVIEGAADYGLADVMFKLPRQQRNDEGYRVLFNPQVRFIERLYTRFHVDLKKIRLRYPLPTLMMMPDVYDRAKVPAEFFNALQGLINLRQVKRIVEAQLHQLFPTIDVLTLIENRYGETITKVDIWGRNILSKSGRNEDSPARRRSQSHSPVRVEMLPYDYEEPEEKHSGGTRSMSAHRRHDRRKGSTHAVNLEFAQSLKHRHTKDYLSIRKQESRAAKEKYWRDRKRRMDEQVRDKVPATYQYGSQKLQYVELKKAAMRTLLARRRDATFSYSDEYTSMSFHLVDEMHIKENEVIESRRKWRTDTGFVWPAPRTGPEMRKHPRKPDPIRVEDLKEPWVEREAPATSASTSGLPPGQPNFNSIPSNGNMVYGGYQKPQFTREYDSSKVGHPTRLPRGHMQFLPTPPTEFYKSIHLGGVEAIRQQCEALAKEKADWLAKVKVDTLDFKMSRLLVRDRPDQLDRNTDILALAARKRIFKKVRKALRLAPAPISAFLDEPYSDIADFTSTYRQSEPEKFLAQKDFRLHIHKDALKPMNQRGIARKKHPEVLGIEKEGAKWLR